MTGKSMGDKVRTPVDDWFVYDVDIAGRTLFLGGEVDDGMAERFLKGLHLLSGKSSDEINITINTTGGDEYHGMAIFDAIACSRCHVTMTGYGNVMSMGSWIMQAADLRVLSPNATMMIHYGSWDKGDEHVKYQRVQLEEMERINVITELAYLPKTTMSLRRLKKMLEDEVYLSAEQAVELGLADKVLDLP